MLLPVVSAPSGLGVGASTSLVLWGADLLEFKVTEKRLRTRLISVLSANVKAAGSGDGRSPFSLEVGHLVTL